MNCPTCGHKLPEGKIECPRCHVGHLAENNEPIVPGRQRGALWLAAGVALVLAIVGGWSWAWFVIWAKELTAVPTLVIGAVVGGSIRLLGGRPSPSGGVLATFVTMLGVGFGLVLIYLRWPGNKEELAAALQIANIAFLLIALSIARSLGGVRKEGMPPLMSGNSEQSK